MASHVIHRLELADAGPRRLRRWTPSCACGWPGTHSRAWARKHKAAAVALYRDHVRNATRRHDQLEPRPLTPADQLPDDLR